ncbi:T9SS type A sorting domain-containing protein [Flavobacterium sp.]|uniref:T9SS type A sorting domain-containing protein n=1 Tax=Flavobacterium sp. TaxID=239 RepID=UPI0039E380A1
MKTNYSFLTLAATVLFSISAWSQATIAQWNFNGPSATEVPGGNDSPTPVVGAGTVALIGGTTATYSSGNTTAGTLETETTSPPNYGWQTTNYAPLGTDNKLRGIQVNVSTVGEAGITFHCEQRLSNTANNTYVVQYTTDRTAPSPVWVDAQTFTFTPAATGTGDTWYNDRTINLLAVTELDNNPNVAFRVVSAFDPNTGDYLAARSTSTYAGGNVRFDMVTVTSAVSLHTTNFSAPDNSFVISPNPTSKGMVYFNKAEDIEVYDALGKLILQKKAATSIDAAAWQSGTYFVKTASGLSRKLIVK